MPRRVAGIISATSRLRTSGRYYKRQNQQWIDPYPEVHGTVPEKMVYAELSRLGIPFLFLNDVHAKIPIINFDKWYQADFIIPAAKLIIEVQGAYWHSMPKTIEADAYKFAIYETIGYKALAWWDYDILARVQDLVISEPSLRSLIKYPAFKGKSSELPVQRRTKVDTSKGIRTLNSRRKAIPSPRTSKRKVRKAKTAYAIF